MIAPLIALILQATAALDTPLPDAAQEARAQALMRELRCTVCENEPVSQSTADMAVDARRKIREQVAQGASDSTVRDFFVSRYGQYVSFRPPTDGWAMALWAFPFALLVGVGALIGLGRFKQRKRDLTPVPDDRSQDDA
jgi:cytochrome c-type biogenesis protein CcmH